MKTLFLIFVLFTGSLFAQNWAPIALETKSVFTKPNYPSPFACFDIDSVVNVSVDTSIFYNYQLYGANLSWDILYPDCQGWGGDCGTIANTTSWLGRKIIKTPNKWGFLTDNDDTLNFEFNSLDTSTIFQNANRKLQMVYIKDTIADIFGIQDSIKQFELFQFDNLNNLVSDELLGKQIRLSKEHGLLDLLEIRNYPDSIGFYSLLGSLNSTDTIGKVTIKKYEMNKRSVGTIFQFDLYKPDYFDGSNLVTGYHMIPIYEVLSSGFSGNNYEYSYSKDTNTTLTVQIDTNVIEYALPFTQEYDGNWTSNPYIDSSECYGVGYYVDRVYQEGEYYCSTNDCYSSYDTGGDVCRITSFITPEIGTVSQSSYCPTIPIWYLLTLEKKRLVYTYINGVSCGNIAYLGIESQSNIPDINIYPNPAQEIISISLSQNSYHWISANIYNSIGSSVLKSEITNDQVDIDISYLSKGVYQVAIQFDNGTVVQKQLIKF